MCPHSSYASVCADGLPTSFTTCFRAERSVDRLLVSMSVRRRLLRLSSTCFTRSSSVHSGVPSTLVVVGARVVYTEAGFCPFGTRAQTTASVFSVSPPRSWTDHRIVVVQVDQAELPPRFAWDIAFERPQVCWFSSSEGSKSLIHKVESE